MVNVPEKVTWEAEEFVVRERNGWWYLGLFAVGAGLSALAVWQGWWTFIALIVVCIVAILTSNFRPPRKIKYVINKEGLKEGNTLHKFEDYKAFGILKEGGNFSAVMIPKKRFGLSVKVYFPSKSGEGIVDILGMHLPMEEVKLDFLDKIVNFLRI
ncbi:hypothetical protein IKF57_02890 [Candidatus Saccharibacteria bacterium]|nr:hypothetical protein [Candidatus Saccharibacteria bacterium]